MDLFEKQSCEFISRHIGPDEHSTRQMLKTIGVPDLDTLISRTVPPAIRMQHELNLPAAMSEHQYLQHIKEVSLQNKVYKNYIGQGYYDTIVPSVILRNVLRIQVGTHSTRLTRLKYRRGVWKAY
jgi:glycine dehydrogenase